MTVTVTTTIRLGFVADDNPSKHSFVVTLRGDRELQARDVCKVLTNLERCIREVEKSLREKEGGPRKATTRLRIVGIYQAEPEEAGGLDVTATIQMRSIVAAIILHSWLER